MPTLHTFGCSITQGFALPDIVRPLSEEQITQLGRPFHWMDVHLLEPSIHAWPSILAQQLDIPLVNHARRGACFQQIARQITVAAPTIQPQDVVIVMWTYLSRISLQWPARNSVPLCNMVDPTTWRTRILPGWNKFFGLTPSVEGKGTNDHLIQQHIETATRIAMNPMSVYNQYYNSLVLQTACDGLLRARGARVIHLSVEREPVLLQLEQARQQLDPSLREPYTIPDPNEWYTLAVNYDHCAILHDPLIPPAENDMHPSVTHHQRFADRIHSLYF